MKKTQFKLLYEAILNELESAEEKQYKSFNEFRHFCKNLDLIAELDKYTDTDTVINCTLYFIDGYNKNKKRFEYLNQSDINYYKKYSTVFNKLNSYKNLYIVTLDGSKDSPKIIWG